MTSLRPKDIKVVISHGSLSNKVKDTNAAIEEIVNSVQLKKVRNANQRHVSRLQKSAKKKMRTSETEHTPGTTLEKMRRDTIDHDNPFRVPKKLPTLRKTPTVIRWPEKPPVIKQKARTDSAKLDDQTPANREINSWKSSKTRVANDKSVKNEVNSRKSSNQEESNKNTKEKSVKISNKRTKHQGSDENILFEESDDESDIVSPWKPVPYANFWDTAHGNIRMDELFIGSPRVDPHHSTWTPAERRCYFLQNNVPPHIRPQLPKSRARE